MAQRNLGRPPLREIRDSHRWDDWNARLYDRVENDEQIRGDQLEVESVRSNRILVTDSDQPSDSTLGNLVSESGSVGLNLTPNHMGYYDGDSWINYFDSDGNAVIGDPSSDNYVEWDQSNGALTVSGSIQITEGSGALNLDDGPTDSGATRNIDFVQDDEPIGADSGDIWIDTSDDEPTPYIYDGDDWRRVKWSKIRSDPDAPEDNADITGDNTAKDIVNLPDTPSDEPGLFASSDHLGYHDGDDWKVYIENNGDFYFEGDSGNYISWDGTELIVEGKLQSSSVESSTIESSAFYTDTSGDRIEITTPDDTGTLDEPSNITFYDSGDNQIIRLGEVGFDEISALEIDSEGRRCIEAKNGSSWTNTILTKTEPGASDPILRLEYESGGSSNTDDLFLEFNSGNFSGGFLTLTTSRDGHSLGVDGPGTDGNATVQTMYHSGLETDHVGALAFAKPGETQEYGDTISGSDLNLSDGDGYSGSSLSGTWKCLGETDGNAATLYVRIA